MSARIPPLPLQRHSPEHGRGSQREHGPLRTITVSGSLTSTGRLALSYLLRGDLAQLQLPEPAGDAPGSGVRRDELWRHTCMELFARGDDAPGYLEFNFSPAGDWAAYGFDAYRAGRRDLEAHDCSTRMQRRGDELQLHFSLSVPLLAPGAGVTSWHLGFAAIAAQRDGTLSYWALRHPRQQPDFHDPAGFSHVLRAPAE
jgi:hypothetical protein